jgi:hypothetical protein
MLEVNLNVCWLIIQFSNPISNVVFEVQVAVTMNIITLWDVMLFGFVEFYQHSRGSSTLKMEAPCSSETFVLVYQISYHHVSANNNLQNL